MHSLLRKKQVFAFLAAAVLAVQVWGDALILSIAPEIPNDFSERTPGGEEWRLSHATYGVANQLYFNRAWSEPLDSNEDSCTDDNWGRKPTDPNKDKITSWDPNDTTGSYQVPGSFVSVNNMRCNEIYMVPEQWMPAGNSVDHVLALDYNTSLSTTIYLVDQTAPSSSAKRRCMRWYETLSEDFETAAKQFECPVGRNKFHQYGWQGGLVQLSEKWSNALPCRTAPDYGLFHLVNHGSGDDFSFPITLGECNTSKGWCRMEVCATGDLADGLNILHEAQIKPLKGETIYEVSHTTVFNPGTSIVFSAHGINAFHGDGDGTGPIGDKFVTHVMLVDWTQDEGQWIGCAPEVEGTAKCPYPGADVVEADIPEWTDFTLRGTAIPKGATGEWDSRLDGMLSPGAMVKKGDTYFLYYIGADGDRQPPYDQGPRFRSAGVATSTNGITFTKYPGNPIVTWQPTPLHEEEGVFSLAAALDPETGDVVLFYGGMTSDAGSLRLVNADGIVATSSDGFNFGAGTKVLQWDDSSVWGNGDELYPVATFERNGTWYVYYIAQGTGTTWDLGLAWGDSITTISDNTVEVLSLPEDIKTVAVNKINPTTLAISMAYGDSPRNVWMRTADISAPAVLSAPVRDYPVPNNKETDVFLDGKKWFMYNFDSVSEDIVVRTAH